jgi:hypothetical protein
MRRDMTAIDHDYATKHFHVEKLDAAEWGLFFIWMGIAILANVGWGIGLLGVGMITLGGQAARRYFNLPLEGFWLAAGILFVVCGVSAFFEPVVPGSFWPTVSIAVGVTFLVSALLRKRSDQK